MQRNTDQWLLTGSPVKNMDVPRRNANVFSNPQMHKQRRPPLSLMTELHTRVPLPKPLSLGIGVSVLERRKTTQLDATSLADLC